MKKISFVRHAKSSWDLKYATDFDREIETRGIEKTENLIQLLINKNIIPDLIISSPAVRTKQTSHLIMSKLNLSADILAFDEKFYSGNFHHYLDAIYATNNKINHLMIIGHNPSISEAAYELSSEVSMMKTSQICHFEFDCENWNQISNAKILHFLSHNPKNPL